MFTRILFATLSLGAASACAAERSAVLDIKGMTCSTCPLTVRQVLRKAPGVRDAKVDLAKARAEVTFDDAVTTIERLAGAVTEAGFQAQARKGAP